jgi:hypothetical protein
MPAPGTEEGDRFTDALDSATSELPEHLARCAECGFSVRFRALSAGAATGFILIGSEQSLGIGDNGRPMCPNGHGEMAIADDQIPAGDAITQVAEKIAEQQPLFEPPPFNSENALSAIYAKRHEVADLEREAEDAADASRRAKKALDAGNESLGRLIEHFESSAAARRFEIERRREVAAGNGGSAPVESDNGAETGHHYAKRGALPDVLAGTDAEPAASPESDEAAESADA